MDTYDVIVIGGGLAGAATAYQLTRRAPRRVAILEQEQMPGMHSSGRNAAILRVVVAGAEVAALAREGGAFIRRTPEDWDEPVGFHPCGSLLTGKRATLERVAADTPPAELDALEVAWWTPEAARRKVTLLDGSVFEAALWCPRDGVIDVAGLLAGYLREGKKHGVRLLTGHRVREFTLDGGSVTGVETDGGTLKAPWVVNAAGSWAREVGRRAGGVDAPMVPHRRHLFDTGPLPQSDPSLPVVWDPSFQVYFRPESGGFLLSPCDEAPAEPGIPPTDPSVLDDLAAKLTRHFPALADVPIRHGWAGLRTFTPDHRFVIGPDPRRRGLFWVAGLGGHGVTTSAAVGRLAAQLLDGVDAPEGAAFSPARFST